MSTDKNFSFRDLLNVDQTQGSWNDDIGLIAYQYKKRRRGLNEVATEEPSSMTSSQIKHYAVLKHSFGWNFHCQDPKTKSIYMTKNDEHGIKSIAVIPKIGNWSKLTNDEAEDFLDEQVISEGVDLIQQARKREAMRGLKYGKMMSDDSLINLYRLVSHARAEYHSTMLQKIQDADEHDSHRVERIMGKNKNDIYNMIGTYL